MAALQAGINHASDEINDLQADNANATTKAGQDLETLNQASASDSNQIEPPEIAML